jgi:hypothetical protein
MLTVWALLILEINIFLWLPIEAVEFMLAGTVAGEDTYKY